MSAPGTPAAPSAVERLLQRGEQLLWVGRSDPGRMLTHADLYLVPSSAVFSVVAVTFLVGALREQPQPALIVLMVALVAIGLHMFVGRFLVKRHRKRTEVYAVTDRRVLVTDGRRTRETDSRRTDWNVDLSADHVSVEWDDISDLDTLFWGGSDQIRRLANTGLDRMPGMRENFALYDVADGDALLDALRRVSGR